MGSLVWPANAVRRSYLTKKYFPGNFLHLMCYSAFPESTHPNVRLVHFWAFWAVFAQSLFCYFGKSCQYNQQHRISKHHLNQRKSMFHSDSISLKMIFCFYCSYMSNLLKMITMIWWLHKKYRIIKIITTESQSPQRIINKEFVTSREARNLAKATTHISFSSYGWNDWAYLRLLARPL